MRKIVLTFGLIAGAILSAMMFATVPLLDTIDFDTGAIIGYSTMVAAFLMIFFGVKAYRDNVLGGKISFGQAFKTGLLIMALGSICYVASWQVIYYRMAPNFGERYAEYMMEKERAGGASEAQLAEKRRELDRFQEMYRKPLYNIAFTFLEPLPVGLIITLVSAGVLSRRKRDGSITPVAAEVV